MLRFVIDTNVIVSALLFANSTPKQALNQALDKGTVLIFQAIIEELTQVLNRKKLDKYISLEERIKFLANLAKKAELIVIQETIDICRDPKDNKFLELAVNGNADYLITGDEDLLVLNPFMNIAIIKPNEFLFILQKQE